MRRMKWIQVIGFSATKEHRFRPILTAMLILLGSAGCDDRRSPTEPPSSPLWQTPDATKGLGRRLLQKHRSLPLPLQQAAVRAGGTASGCPSALRHSSEGGFMKGLISPVAHGNTLRFAGLSSGHHDPHS